MKVLKRFTDNDENERSVYDEISKIIGTKA